MSSPRGPSIAGKRRRSVATISAVSATESVVWVENASCAGSGTSTRSASSTVSTSSTLPGSTCPMVPITSG